VLLHAEPRIWEVDCGEVGRGLVGSFVGLGGDVVGSEGVVDADGELADGSEVRLG